MDRRLKILDLWVDPVDMHGALEAVRGFVEKGDRPHSVFAVNPEKNFSVPADPQLLDVFRNADLLIPDGIGVVIAARVLHGAALQRVPGVELMRNLCRLAAQRSYGVFVFGAHEEVNRQAVELLTETCPGLEVVGRRDGYVTEQDMPDLVSAIDRSKAQILFLALGSPKQEKWIAAWGHRLANVRVIQGIGGSLDAITGRVKRAPESWQRLGLEWLFRLITEPKRIKRQRVLPVFAARVLLEWVRSKIIGRNRKA